MYMYIHEIACTCTCTYNVHVYVGLLALLCNTTQLAFSRGLDRYMYMCTYYIHVRICMSIVFAPNVHVYHMFTTCIYTYMTTEPLVHDCAFTCTCKSMTSVCTCACTCMYMCIHVIHLQCSLVSGNPPCSVFLPVAWCQGRSSGRRQRKRDWLAVQTPPFPQDTPSCLSRRGDTLWMYSHNVSTSCCVCGCVGGCVGGCEGVWVGEWVCGCVCGWLVWVCMWVCGWVWIYMYIHVHTCTCVYM